MMNQMIAEMRPDTLHRGVKMALDNGEADSVEAAYALFASYRMAIGLGAAGGQSPAVQAALLTMVNCGRRALLGGVEVLGDLQVPLLVDLPGLGETLGDAVVALGGTPRAELSPQTPLTWLGDATAWRRATCASAYHRPCQPLDRCESGPRLSRCAS